MSRIISRRLNIGLAIFGLVTTILLMILFFASKGFTITAGENLTYASLFTLGFGGPWYNSGSLASTNYQGNALMGIAFVFVVIANILAIVFLYGIISKKFLPKTNRILSIAIFVLLLSSTIVVCSTKIIALSISKEEVSNYIKLTGNTITYIVFGFLAVIGYIGITAITFVKKKETN